MYGQGLFACALVGLGCRGTHKDTNYAVHGELLSQYAHFIFQMNVKMNLSVGTDIGESDFVSILEVTLFADTKKNRPAFTGCLYKPT